MYILESCYACARQQDVGYSVGLPRLGMDYTSVRFGYRTLLLKHHGIEDVEVMFTLISIIYILCKYRVLCIHWQTLCSDQIGTASFGLACESTSSWVQLHPRQGLAVLPLRQDMDWRSPMAKKYELELSYILPSILPPWIGFQIGYPMVPRRKNPRVHHRLLRLLVQSGYGSKLLTTFNSLKLDYMIQTI